ncbi:Atxe2 family lasso peptide isopeptidase [Luteimonas suaedae]|uniref:Atxe2 family lasso peptide isopeptidase n=1 Tax=Luteimonas suaedae TaxID=2605430 RepID=UPI0021020687|nr:Atxe2 family lasso peptide isopeptidase [Luteimonas suaedae]
MSINPSGQDMNRSNGSRACRPWASVAIRLMVLAGLLSVLVGARAGEVVSPRRLIEVVDISGPVVSPDGTRVAFRTEQASIDRNTYDSVWYVQDMEGDAPARRIGEGGPPLRTSAGLTLPAMAAWSPDGRWIYYRAFMDGRIDVWRANADGSGAKPVTQDLADVRDFSVSADGRSLVYSVGATREEVIAAEQAEYERGIRVDRSVPIGQGALFRSGNVEGRLATQRLDYLGDGFARVPLLSEVPDRWKAIDLVEWTARDAVPAEIPSPGPVAPSLSRDASGPWRSAYDPARGRIAVLTRIGEQGNLVQKPDVELSAVLEEGGGRVRCQADACAGKPISDVQWGVGSDEVIFTVTDPAEGLAQSIFRWNVGSGEVVPVVRAQGLLNGGQRYGVADTGCGRSLVALACVASDANRPPRLERVDLETGERRVLFDPNASLHAAVSLATPVRLLRWKDAAGRQFTGQFFAAQRADDKPPPLFIAYYYCPGFLRSGFGGEWPLATLAEKGISSLCVNYPPFRFDALERFNEGLAAVKSAVEMLASAGEIDPARVGMGELSFGTEITMWTAFNSDLLKAASITGAVLSRSMYLHGTLKGEEFVSRAKRIWQLGPPDETADQWKRIGLEFNVDKVSAPVLMQIPEQEYLWLLDSAVPLMLEQKADLYVFPHAPHFKFQPRHLLAANERNVDWFRFWLQDYEDPAPEKRQQYLGWRNMKARAVDRDGHEPVEGGSSLSSNPVLRHHEGQ